MKISVRETKKLRNRERILDVAFDLFSRHGFRKTTINQIAQEAEMGTGTVYNYFPSKEHLLAAIIRENAMQNIDRFQVENHLDDPLDEVLLLFDFIFQSIPLDRRLQQESLSAIFLPPDDGPSSPKNNLTSQVDEIDFYIIGIISAILKKGKNNKKLKARFSEDVAAMTIYSAFMFCWFKYIKGYFNEIEAAKHNFVQMTRALIDELGY